jgi:ABC-2 type transport system permease protein
MYALFIKEVRSFLNSLIGYIAIGVFLILTSLFIWFFPGLENIFDTNQATLNALFYDAPIIFLLLVPAITMRAFAEEKRQGTIEFLFTKPLTELDIVLAKFFAGVFLVLFSLIPTLIYFISIFYLSTPVGNVDTGGIIGGYLGLLMLGAGFVAIGVFCSSLTQSQVLSFILSLALCFMFYTGFEYAAEGFESGVTQYWVQKIGIFSHYTSIRRGIIDTRDVIYFIGLIVTFITLTKLSLLSRKW